MEGHQPGTAPPHRRREARTAPDEAEGPLLPPPLADPAHGPLHVGKVPAHLLRKVLVQPVSLVALPAARGSAGSRSNSCSVAGIACPRAGRTAPRLPPAGRRTTSAASGRSARSAA